MSEQITLEQRYNNAAPNSYVGLVRSQQAADAGAIGGVNNLDGVPRGQNNDAPDEYQDEFQRNPEGAYRYGGEGKNPAATNDGSYPLSRWLEKGLTKAFEGDGSYFQNNRFTSIGDIRNAPGTRVHNYAPLADRDFISNLQDLSKGKVLGSPKGPAPGRIR